MALVRSAFRRRVGGGGALPAIGFLLGAGALIGVSANLAKLAAAEGVPALPFLLWSVLGAGLILAAVNAVGERGLALDRRTAEYLVVSALLSVAAPMLLLFAAVPHVGAAFVALAIAFPPLFTYAAALALGMERWRTRRAAGVVLALGGASLIAMGKLAAPEVEARWIAAVMVAPVVLAAGNIYRTARWPAGASPAALAPGMLLAAAGLLALASPVVSGMPGVPWGANAATGLVAVQAVAFALQYLCFFALQKRGGPVMVSFLGSVSAVVGVPLAVLLLGEAVPRGLLAGGVLIAVGIGLVARR